MGHLVAELGHVIAANVRAERARRHWRQADLAARLGWDTGTVGHIETGRRDVRATDLPALCRAFGVGLDVLFFGANEDDAHAMCLQDAQPVPTAPPTVMRGATRTTDGRNSGAGNLRETNRPAAGEERRRARG